MNKNEELLPYYERAKELLNYDPETGIFTKHSKRKGVHRKVGTVSRYGYWQISICLDKQKVMLAHRLAWFIYYGELPTIIDHIDGNRLNNSISNLRVCSSRENNLNKTRKSNTKSGRKGVSWYKRDSKWEVRIKHKNKNLHLGLFDDIDEASKVYEEKAKELHGEFYYKRRGEK